MTPEHESQADEGHLETRTTLLTPDDLPVVEQLCDGHHVTTENKQ